MNKAFLSDLLSAIGNRARNWRELSYSTLGSQTRDGATLCNDLLSRRGEVSGTTLARTILDHYSGLDEVGRLRFFEMLAIEFGPDRNKLERAIAAKQGPTARDSDIHFDSEPRRQELFRRLNRAPGGTSTLVLMREQLLECLNSNADLAVVDRDFLHLFSSWFNRGFLVLRRIDWNTPANILERIIQYEAVHAIRSWDDLRNRLKPGDRRCFAFFHPQLNDEPLVFVEVALTKAIPATIGPLLSTDRTLIVPEDASTAVFYSISNTQKGLAGVSFGSLLIKQVVADLQSEFSQLKNFVTLSPMPGFAAWLRNERDNPDSKWIDPSWRADLELTDELDWHNDPVQNGIVQSTLLPLAATYLAKAKTSNGRPADSVARFHLGNGARLERLNFLGDPSPNGLKQSHGIMVNYRYAFHEMQENHEAYAEGGIIAISPEVLGYLRHLNSQSRSPGRIGKWNFGKSATLSRSRKSVASRVLPNG
jgi:malonyl-CoA decarboxylase